MSNLQRKLRNRGLHPQGYEPNAFDLITPSHDGQALTTKLIPSIFFEAEAVESAGLLGEGASFVARKYPEVPR